MNRYIQAGLLATFMYAAMAVTPAAASDLSPDAAAPAPDNGIQESCQEINDSIKDWTETQRAAFLRIMAADVPFEEKRQALYDINGKNVAFNGAAIRQVLARNCDRGPATLNMDFTTEALAASDAYILAHRTSSSKTIPATDQVTVADEVVNVPSKEAADAEPVPKHPAVCINVNYQTDKWVSQQLIMFNLLKGFPLEEQKVFFKEMNDENTRFNVIAATAIRDSGCPVPPILEFSLELADEGLSYYYDVLAPGTEPQPEP